MEKYGVVHEYVCDGCGEKKLVRDNEDKITIIKHAAVGKSTHVHDYKEILEDGSKAEGGSIRPERSGSEAEV